MPRPPGIQITRDRRKDGSTTFGLRVRISGGDERIPLGNTVDGWDEIRAEHARKQLLAKIELGQWSPRPSGERGVYNDEPTFRELATNWLQTRKRNPAIRPRTTELNEWQLTRYLAPFFGELLPSQITVGKIKRYRDGIHQENEQIRNAAEAGRPLRDGMRGLRLRTLSNESINKTLRTLALILDEAEDAGWIERNVARGRRMREPLERRRPQGTLDVDEFLDLLEARVNSTPRAGNQRRSNARPGSKPFEMSTAWYGRRLPRTLASLLPRRSTSMGSRLTNRKSAFDARSSPLWALRGRA